MSGNSQAAKIGLDARAAELKEKLLRSRSQQNQARLNSSPVAPSPARTDSHAPTSLTSSLPTSSGPSVERVKPSVAPYGPHETPSQAVEASLPADANDIAALISSISSSVSEIPGLSISNTPSNDTSKPPAEKVTPAKVQGPLPTGPSPKISFPLPAQRPGPLPTKQFKNGVMSLSDTPSKDQTDQTKPSPKESELTTPQRKESMATGPNTVSAVSTTNTAKTPVSSSNNRQGSFGKQTKETSIKRLPQISTQLGSGTNLSTPDASRSQVSGTPVVPRELKSNNGEEAAGDRKNTSQKPSGPVSYPVSSDDAATRLLAQVPDLKDWLELTDYYNVETRIRKLDRFRRVRALAAEKLRIEEEERKLMEEEELEMGGWPRSTASRLASATASNPSTASESVIPSLLTPTTPLAVGETKGIPPVQPTKRALEELDSEGFRSKVPRLAETPIRSQDTSIRGGESARQEEHSGRRDSQPDKLDSHSQAPRRGSSPRRRPLPPSSRRSPLPWSREHSPHRQSRSGPRHHSDYDSFDDRPRKYDSYRNGSRRSGSRHRDSGQNAIYPIHVDLGRKGGRHFQSSYHYGTN